LSVAAAVDSAAFPPPSLYFITFPAAAAPAGASILMAITVRSD